MEIIQQLINGLDKGTAYALIALGLSLIFGTLGVVNFAHGALFMIGMFVAVTIQQVLNIPVEHPTEVVKDFLGNENPGGTAAGGKGVRAGNGRSAVLNNGLWISLLVSIPVMAGIGVAMDRWLIRFLLSPAARRADPGDLWTGDRAAGADQDHLWRATPTRGGRAGLHEGHHRSWAAGLGWRRGALVYPTRRIVFVIFGLLVLAATFSFIQFTRFGMVVRAGMQDREMVDLLGDQHPAALSPSYFALGRGDRGARPASCTRPSKSRSTSWA